MAIPLDPKQVVSFEELLRSKVVQQETLTRLFIEKGLFTKEEFLEMVRIVDSDIKRKKLATSRIINRNKVQDKL